MNLSTTVPRLEDMGDRCRLWIDDTHSMTMGGDAAKWMRNVCRSGLHEPKLSELMMNLSRTRDGAFFDIGALYGYFALLVGITSPKPRTIHAFEMNPRPARIARRMITLNHEVTGLFSDARVHNVAVGARNQILPAKVDGYTLDITSGTDDTESVKFEAIDRYCQRQNIQPSFIKIDVEGWEGMVLNGMVRTLRVASPVLAVELHASDWIGRTGLSRTSVVQLLLAIGYRCYSVHSHRAVGAMAISELTDPGFAEDSRRFENQSACLIVACRGPIEESFPGIAFIHD